MNLDTMIYVVTAPSGTGKTTLNRKLTEKFEDIAISISHTTREKRPKEVHGDHYWFISQSEFHKKVKSGLMLEWAEVFGNFYGTSIEEVHRIQKLGKTPILEIDVQGWELSKSKIKHAKSIFILPPSMKELYERLNNRGTETPASISRRIRTANMELQFAKNYDFFVINDHLDHAFEELEKIVSDPKYPSNKDFGLKHCQKLIEECHSPWLQKVLENKDRD